MKLYRQVSTSERMPDKNGQYLTDIGNMQFDIRGNRFIYYCDITNKKLNRHANCWMEEIEIPNEEQVFELIKQDCKNEFDFYHAGVGASAVISLIKG